MSDLFLKNSILKPSSTYFQPGGKAGKDSGKAKAKAVSRSARAGLQVSKAYLFTALSHS